MLNYWPEEVKFCYKHKHYCCISKSVLKKIKCKFVKLTDHHAYDMEKKKKEPQSRWSLEYMHLQINLKFVCQWFKRYLKFFFWWLAKAKNSFIAPNFSGYLSYEIKACNTKIVLSCMYSHAKRSCCFCLFKVDHKPRHTTMLSKTCI